MLPRRSLTIRVVSLITLSSLLTAGLLLLVPAHTPTPQRLALCASHLILMLLLTRQQLRSSRLRIRALSQGIQAVATGDLARRPAPQTTNPDEIDLMAQALERTVDAQRALVERLVTTTLSLHNTAVELQGAAEDQQRFMLLQATDVEQVRGILDSFRGNAARIADTARTVMSDAEQSSTMADTSAGCLAQLTTHTQRVTLLLDTVREVGERSTLLALNAALEANRAGESGQTFSLVAGEMRRLAEKAAHAVQDMKSLVLDISTSSHATAEATRECRRLAESTTASARAITTVTSAQSSATSQLSQNLLHAWELFDGAVARADQVRATAANLRDQADTLAQSLSYFQLDRSYTPKNQLRRPRGYQGQHHQIIGSDILAVYDAIEHPAALLPPAWQARLQLLDPTGWYPISEMLDLTDFLSQHLDAAALRQLGSKLFERTHEPRVRGSLRSARELLYGLHSMYQHAHRGEHIGGWRVLLFEPGRAELEKTTPHHCQVEEGILLRALTMVGVPASIEQIQCFRRGGDLCHFVIKSAVQDARWG